jgi:hypothetical protein
MLNTSHRFALTCLIAIVVALTSSNDVGASQCGTLYPGCCEDNYWECLAGCQDNEYYCLNLCAEIEDSEERQICEGNCSQAYVYCESNCYYQWRIDCWDPE